MIYISVESINRIITYYTHAFHSHPEKGTNFFRNYTLSVVDDLVQYATLHMQKSQGPTITDWNTNGWQKYNSKTILGVMQLRMMALTFL